VKALLVDRDARPVVEATVEYGISHPRPGWSEQNAEDWWTSLVAATRQAINAAGNADVQALAISTQGDTLVPVDDDCRPLAPARTWMDTRTGDLIPPLEAQVDSQTWYETTGSRLGPYAAGMTIAWLREHKPDVYAQAARFALVEDFVVERLTGEPALDFPNASRTLMFDIRLREWSGRLTDVIGVEQERLSPTLPSGAVAGLLSEEAAEALGIKAGIPVALGGHDQTCAAVGAGVVSPGEILLSCGTAWVLLASVDRVLLDGERRRVQTYCHAAPDRWALLTAHAGGNVLAWMRETLYGGDAVTYAEIDADAQRALDEGGPGLLVLPHFYGANSPHWMRQARGVIAGLTLGRRREDLALGMLRGVGLEVMRHFATFRDMGAAPDEIRMIGGGAKSRLWAQIIADCTQATVVLPEVREAAAYGAAVLAGVSAGIFESVDEVVAALPISARPYVRSGRNGRTTDRKRDMKNDTRSGRIRGTRNDRTNVRIRGTRNDRINVRTNDTKNDSKNDRRNGRANDTRNGTRDGGINDTTSE